MEIRSHIERKRSLSRADLARLGSSLAFLARLDSLLITAASGLLVLGSWLGLLPFSEIEVFGFVSGAVCVWLLVKENIWNWPVGVVNAGFFLVLFLQSRLFADSALQVVYVVLGLWGWYYWLRGGSGRKEREIAKTGRVEWLWLLALTAVATYGLLLYLRSIQDTAPFWDALTTSLSLAATWMQARKLIENWWLWIAADLVYVPLYFVKQLPLTGVLYVVFLLMCLRGLSEWRRRLGKDEAEPAQGKRFAHGVVAGKFYPFHSGHRYLIEAALAQCERVTVLVCYHRSQSIPAELRAAWIKAVLPQAAVVCVDQEREDLPEADTVEDSRRWAEWTVSFLGEAPDAVFSSEAYGARWARFMGAAHVEVDKPRRAVPISGTEIRQDPLAHLDYLDPLVRSYFVKRVCLLGAESTGKTTLARALAAHYKTVWVPEYGHVYTAFRTDPQKDWKTDEFLHIGRVQNWLEDFLAGYADRVLVCDTDSFVTARFHEEYVGVRDEAVEALSEGRGYDLYVLCDPETPFQQDELNLRLDGPHRRRMHEAYKERLEELSAEYVEVSGSVEERLALAVAAIDRLVNEPALARPSRQTPGLDLVPSLRLAEGM